jgi:hypothetical protein
MSITANTIIDHAAAFEAASAGNWLACAASVAAIAQTEAPRLCGGVETAQALDASGPRRRAIMIAMQNDPDGRFVLAKLASTGVMWAHPMTAGLMDALIVAKVMDPADKAALVQLSAPTTYPFADVTADDCHKAWILGQAFAARAAIAARANNLDGWLSSYDTNDKTVEQVQKFVDDLLITSDGNPLTLEAV